MKTFALLLIMFTNSNANTVAITNENSVVLVFKKTESVKKKFLQDTMKNRQLMEQFVEYNFIPASDKMISLLDKNLCKSCLPSYLDGLSFLEGSADENLTDQLKKIIDKKPELLASACTKIAMPKIKMLQTRFKDATHFLSLEKKVDPLQIIKLISKCL